MVQFVLWQVLSVLPLTLLIFFPPLPHFKIGASCGKAKHKCKSQKKQQLNSLVRLKAIKEALRTYIKQVLCYEFYMWHVRKWNDPRYSQTVNSLNCTWSTRDITHKFSFLLSMVQTKMLTAFSLLPYLDPLLCYFSHSRSPSQMVHVTFI